MPYRCISGCVCVDRLVSFLAVFESDWCCYAQVKNVTSPVINGCTLTIAFADDRSDRVPGRSAVHIHLLRCCSCVTRPNMLAEHTCDFC